ncbi:phage major capsid protein [Brachybacterium sp.]|uniref:phage major capsid protein n=1 Tax=Brachybacterium sp. TaxID=1891286 RepID=UPI002ED3640B
MNLKQQRAAALKAAQDIAAKAKADGRELTDDEVSQIDAKIAEVGELDKKIEAAQKSRASLDRLAGLGDEPGTVGDGDQGGDSDESGVKAARSFGERFTKSAAYGAFQKQFPTGVGSGSPVNIGKVKVGTLEEHFGTKALTSPVAHVQPTRFPTIDQVDRNRLTFLDLISRGTAAGAFEYVQIISVERNAAIVPEATSGTDDAALKPTSGLSTNMADAKPYTYADGYDVTNQLLADAPAFASYMNQELGYSLDSLIEDKLLNGTGTNGEPKGLLHTTGVQEVEYALGADFIEKVKAIRRAITRITRLPGGTVQAIVLNPIDAAEVDLLQDADGRFYGQGPFGSGPGTLWGRPIVESERVPEGQFILGDFKQIALLDVEGLSVLAFNQHKDYAQRNMTYVRAELRAEQVIWKPSRLLILGEAAA